MKLCLSMMFFSIPSPTLTLRFYDLCGAVLTVILQSWPAEPAIFEALSMRRVVENQQRFVFLGDQTEPWRCY